MATYVFGLCECPAFCDAEQRMLKNIEAIADFLLPKVATQTDLPARTALHNFATFIRVSLKMCDMKDDSIVKE
ncbi:hypothetical protein CFR80_15225 [Komagataeibacter oboediens]|uniref:Uncharacterized protein n=1 Tax=Komagataeibacter oboediens TaxID=65958 RepID=A0A318QW29_9PROT|nr:hypothetical protein CFR80_15225 [Komagataeibacter oboediens]